MIYCALLWRRHKVIHKMNSRATQKYIESEMNQKKNTREVDRSYTVIVSSSWSSTNLSLILSSSHRFRNEI